MKTCYRFHHHIFVHLFLIRFHLFRFIFHFLFQNSKSETIFTHVRARSRWLNIINALMHQVKDLY